ncbi:DeoR/GlpR family DNA-binding transcription regulator [Clostridium sp.]|uniref:DeoR/GlpR family DNA-binding transcription regulator n=1 Tax=Clostridium sp. TaxID=1506 RepID=UPI003463EE0E
MYQEERLQYILNHLSNNKHISIEEICLGCNVSKDTARRDLVYLEREGKIIRTHGGALVQNKKNEIKSYSSRLKVDSKEKSKIGNIASNLVEDGDLIILDTSTTVEVFSHCLKNKICTVVTNSINVAEVFIDNDNIDVHILGGKINKKHRFLYGGYTLDMLNNYFADKVFLGALGVSEYGITVDSDEDAKVMSKMIEQGKEVIVLVDSSKINNSAHFKVCDIDKVSLIVTDKKPSNEFMKMLGNKKVELIFE